MYFTIGLLFIIVGWIIQLFKVLKQDRNISPYMLILYTIGVLFLVVGNYSIGDITSTLLNIIAAILPLIVLIFLVKSK
ncbi:MAG: hypothetical protein HVN34_02400 [Methanobacteriaceae archaeon]|jgi:uncharacterized protein with PQ loop repeat|nr:hypothetical protein [Methanobacteriaceae archaeon]